MDYQELMRELDAIDDRLLAIAKQVEGDWDAAGQLSSKHQILIESIHSARLQIEDSATYAIQIHRRQAKETDHEE